VNVLGRPYSIRYVDQIDEEGAWGECAELEAIIKLSKDATCTEDRMESTLLHETIHAILYVGGVSQLLDTKTNEAITTVLENGLHQLYKRR
jgi:hypothetical protein